MKKIFRFLTKIKTFVSAHQTFPDGTEIRRANRIGLQFINGDRSVNLNFDTATSELSGIVRLISLRNLKYWNPPFQHLEIDQNEKNDLEEKLVQYCEGRRIRYLIEK